MKLKDYYLTRIIKFIKDESPEIYKLFKPTELRDRISKHMDFNTIVCLWNKEELAGACIFNIDEEECDVHHAIVAKKYRYGDVLKQMVAQGHVRYPFVKFLKFDRELKYPKRSSVLIPIEKFLKGV